jgi:nitroreductase
MITVLKLKDLIYKSRFYRRFDESSHVKEEVIEELIALAGMSASVSNRHPLKYLLITCPELFATIFPYLAWVSYLNSWQGLDKGKCPSSYLIILSDRSITDSFSIDPGIAAQNIMPGVTQEGTVGCMIASENKVLRKEFIIPQQFKPLTVIAPGKPSEKFQIDAIMDNDFNSGGMINKSLMLKNDHLMN